MFDIFFEKERKNLYIQYHIKAKIGSFPVSPLSNSILKSLFNVVIMQ